MTAIDAAASFDPRRGTPRAWLLGIAAHELAHLYRRAASRLLPGGSQAPAAAARIRHAVQQADDVVIHATQWLARDGFRSLEFDASGKPVLDTAQRGGDYRQDDLTAAFRSPHLKVVGHERIDGRDALHLRDDEPGMGREIWVDAHRYLPLRMVEKLSRIDYEWLPYDEKLLWPAPPAGARLVAAPAVKEKKPVR